MEAPTPVAHSVWFVPEMALTIIPIVSARAPVMTSSITRLRESGTKRSGRRRGGETTVEEKRVELAGRVRLRWA
jgi:hypothetical protein